MSKSVAQEKVSSERWRTAQEWERQHWIEVQAARGQYGKNYLWRFLSWFGLLPAQRGDDWNVWWSKQFDDYAFLPSSVQNALEVGCGPYTNMRLILRRCHPEHLVLSDPLIRTYAKFKLTFVAEMYRQVACVLDDHPLEDLPFADNYFDLSVMINVLDHVRDARLCMENLIRRTKPGGITIIGQDLTDEEDLARVPDDTGHPIRLGQEWFRPFLDERFAPIIYKVLPRERGREPRIHCGTLVFAGRKVAV